MMYAGIESIDTLLLSYLMHSLPLPQCQCPSPYWRSGMGRMDAFIDTVNVDVDVEVDVDHPPLSLILFYAMYHVPYD